MHAVLRTNHISRVTIASRKPPFSTLHGSLRAGHGRMNSSNGALSQLHWSGSTANTGGPAAASGDLALSGLFMLKLNLW